MYICHVSELLRPVGVDPRLIQALPSRSAELAATPKNCKPTGSILCVTDNMALP